MIFSDKKFYFISGLPRSGSTVLSCILNQNPNFYSGLGSPVLEIMDGLETHVSKDEFYNADPKPTQVHNIISSIIHQYYGDVEKPVVFDKNRSWPGKINYIESYIKQRAKIICLVRDINEILASFISLIRKNQNTKNVFDFEIETYVNKIPNDAVRCDYLMSEDGVIYRSLDNIRVCFDNRLTDRLHFVEYNDLTQNPEKTFEKIYEFLEEPYFQHDFENIVQDKIENDLEVYGLDGMHRVRKTLSKQSVDPRIILGPEIYNKYKNMEYWRPL